MLFSHLSTLLGISTKELKVTDFQTWTGINSASNHLTMCYQPIPVQICLDLEYQCSMNFLKAG